MNSKNQIPGYLNIIIKPKYPTVNPNEISMVGDSTTDIQFAKNVGMDMCLYTDTSVSNYDVEYEISKLDSLLKYL